MPTPGRYLSEIGRVIDIGDEPRLFRRPVELRAGALCAGASPLPGAASRGSRAARQYQPDLVNLARTGARRRALPMTTGKAWRATWWARSGWMRHVRERRRRWNLWSMNSACHVGDTRSRTAMAGLRDFGSTDPFNDELATGLAALAARFERV
jgi:hypothetical protein